MALAGPPRSHEIGAAAKAIFMLVPSTTSLDRCARFKRAARLVENGAGYDECSNRKATKSGPETGFCLPGTTRCRIFLPAPEGNEVVLEGGFYEIRPRFALALLAGDRAARGSNGHVFSHRDHESEFSGGVEGPRNQGEELGGELYAARGFFGELHPPEEFFQ